MSGIYTNLAKMRSQQNKEPTTVPVNPPVEQQPVMPSHAPALPTQKEQRPRKTNAAPKQAKKNGAKDGKHQLGGWIPVEYFEKFILLHRSVNPLSAETVEKQFMLGLAVNTLCRIMGKDVPVFPSEEAFQNYLEAKLKDKF